MRVANRGSMDGVKHNLARPAEQMSRLYSQLSSGKRLERPSDDPLAVVRTVRAHAGLQEVAARQLVVQQGQQLLGAADGALGEVANSLSQAKQLALRGASSTVGDSERGALAEQVRALASSLVAVGNTSVGGQYLFAGSQTDAPPLEAVEGATPPVQYRGNSHQLSYQVRPDEQIPVSFTGAQVFNYPDASGARPVDGTDRDVFTLLEDVATAIEAGDTDQLGALSTQLDALHAHEVSLRGQGGMFTQQYDRALTNADDTSLLLNQILADEESVDYAAAMVDLSNLQTTYDAALSITSRMLETPNLFDLLS